MSKRKALTEDHRKMIAELKKVPLPPSAPRRFIKFKSNDPKTETDVHRTIVYKLENGGFLECDDSLDIPVLAEFAKHMSARVALALVFFAIEGIDQVEGLFEMLDMLLLKFRLSGVLLDPSYEDEWRRNNPFSQTMLEAHFLGRLDSLDTKIKNRMPSNTLTIRRLFQSKYFHARVLTRYTQMRSQLQGYITEVKDRVPTASLLEIQMYVLNEVWFTEEYEFEMTVDEFITYREILDAF
jgi:hypothetical protein